MMAPFKRQRQPKMTTQALLGFDLGESSSDSDFRIDDFDSDNSKDDDDEAGDNSSKGSTSSDDDDAEDDDDGNGDSDDSTLQLKQLLAESTEEIKEEHTRANKKEDVVNGGDNLANMLRKIDAKSAPVSKVPMKAICCVCLGDRSDDSNEIVECDGCGVSVHEGCYGVSDNNSISSTNSTCSTEPWFCEACRAGVSEPTCELCPNKGGIYKETDVGRWVHLVCALYVPGVAFGEVDQLSCVTLFEMQYSKWGAKACSLCDNSRFARTGVCIGCDAGMCKNYFHVTCAQAAGFLTEAHHEDTEAADPFYAHCKAHSEKEMVRKRKRNYHTFRLNMEQKQKEKTLHKLDEPCPAQMRINRKLQKYQVKYTSHKQSRPDPWVPTQKMSRLLTTSASACHRFSTKAHIMDVDVDLMEQQEIQIQSLTDIRKKWHIAPAFSVEFVAYYMDRIARTKELKEQLTEMVTKNSNLTKEQDHLRTEYDSLLENNKDLKQKHESLINSISQLQTNINSLCPNKNLPNPTNIGKPVSADNPDKPRTPPYRPISVPTAAALKMGVGFPLARLGHPSNKKGDNNRLLSTQAKDSPTLSCTNLSPIMGFFPTSMQNATQHVHKSSVHNNLMRHLSVATTPLVETHNCGICKKSTDQHLLAKCDTCKLFYHLGCLNPPLTRHPKKSKLYGWQCSECDKSDQSDGVAELPKGPRKSRTRFNKDGTIVPVRTGDEFLNNDSSYGPGPAKRRSLDNNQSINLLSATSSTSSTTSTSFKKLLNRSLPNVIELPTATEFQIPNNEAAMSPTIVTVCTNNNSSTNNNNNNSNDSYPGKISPKLCKKSKLSLNYSKSSSQQQQQPHLAQPHEKPHQSTGIVNKESVTKNLTTNTKPIENIHHEPLVVQSSSLSNDEPLVLVMAPKSTTPLPSAADPDPLALPAVPASSSSSNLEVIASLNNINSLPLDDMTDGQLAKQSRKQKRKDKHKNKHNHSSDTERSLSKEHKRKRKKKQHDIEPSNDTLTAIPKIKIKFKTLPLPGEVTPEAQFFYVPANMVRSADEASRPGSVESIDDNTTQSTLPEDPPPTSQTQETNVTNISPPQPASVVKAKTAPNSPSIVARVTSPVKNVPSPRKCSPRKLMQSRASLNASSGGGAGSSTSAGRSKGSAANQTANQILSCCVCRLNGTSTNSVTCDECRKHYHFTCLDPPLKKTPKIRGYSWHCADCDPTDEEKH